MSEERLERVGRQHHDFAEILDEANERASECVEYSSKHLQRSLDVQRLSFRFRSKLGRNRAAESRIERKFAKDRADLAESDGRLVELEVDQVVVAIGLVTQTGNGRQLMIELQDSVQTAQTGRVNFQFQHGSLKFYG